AAGRGQPGLADALDAGPRRTVAERAQELVERRAGTLGNAADTAVRLVRDPAGQACLRRASQHEIAVAHALDPPADDGFEALESARRRAQATLLRCGQARTRP